MTSPEIQNLMQTPNFEVWAKTFIERVNDLEESGTFVKAHDFLDYIDGSLTSSFRILRRYGSREELLKPLEKGFFEQREVFERISTFTRLVETEISSASMKEVKETLWRIIDLTIDCDGRVLSDIKYKEPTEENDQQHSARIYVFFF